MVRDKLSPRLREVLGLLAEGYTYQEIAERLVLSRHSVRTYVHRILVTLDARNAKQAIAILLRERV